MKNLVIIDVIKNKKCPYNPESDISPLYGCYQCNCGYKSIFKGEENLICTPVLKIDYIVPKTVIYEISKTNKFYNYSEKANLKKIDKNDFNIWINKTLKKGIVEISSDDFDDIGNNDIIAYDRGQRIFFKCTSENLNAVISIIIFTLKRISYLYKMKREREQKGETIGGIPDLMSFFAYSINDVKKLKTLFRLTKFIIDSYYNWVTDTTTGDLVDLLEVFTRRPDMADTNLTNCDLIRSREYIGEYLTEDKTSLKSEESEIEIDDLFEQLDFDIYLNN